MHDRNTIAIATFLGLMLATTAASAGRRVIEPVRVFDEVDHATAKSTGGGRAQGALADARASPDSIQNIGCWTTEHEGVCYATDATGKTRGCVTQDPEQLAVIRSLTPESMLYFRWTSIASASCASIYVVTDSTYKPAATSGD